MEDLVASLPAELRRMIFYYLPQDLQAICLVASLPASLQKMIFSYLPTGLQSLCLKGHIIITRNDQCSCLKCAVFLPEPEGQWLVHGFVGFESQRCEGGVVYLPSGMKIQVLAVGSGGMGQVIIYVRLVCNVIAKYANF